jgi:diphosphomevalonate decarboxylase
MGKMKATAIAHPNVALIKYWGKADDNLKTPMNNSISVTIDGLYCKVTVDFSEEYKKDWATINGQEPQQKTLERAAEQLDTVRKAAGITLRAKSAVEMNFQVGIGLASSSAGFAALTAAAAKAAGLKLDKKALSILARKGSGSSCRSIYGGFVEWVKGSSDKTSYAMQLADEKWLDLRTISAVVSTKERMADTRGGMKIAKDTSPLYAARLKFVEKELPLMRKAIKNKDFSAMGKIAERDCMLLHATAITADPVLLYWTPETLKIMHAVRVWRQNGLEAYYTVDTGANIHVFCMPENEQKVLDDLQSIGGITSIHKNKPGEGARLIDGHLF